MKRDGWKKIGETPGLLGNFHFRRLTYERDDSLLLVRNFNGTGAELNQGLPELEGAVLALGETTMIGVSCLRGGDAVRDKAFETMFEERPTLLGGHRER